MPYHPTKDSAQHALDEVQGQAADNNYAWRGGLVPSLTTSTTAIESETTGGTILWDGTLTDIPQKTHTHDAGDTEPRWDTLCVTDAAGTIEVVKGVPAEPAALEDGTVLRGEPAFSPSPSDQISREMVTLALVWIPSGATTNQDLTDETAGGVADPVVDRRYPQPGRAREQSYRATIQSNGWHRVASNGPVEPGGSGGDRAHAMFTVRSTQSRLHSSATFYASVEFNENPTLTLLNADFFGSDGGAIEAIRLVSGGPDEVFSGAAVDINVQRRGEPEIDYMDYSIFDNRHTGGWTPEPWTAGGVPSGFEVTKISLNPERPLMAAAANGDNTSFYIGRGGAIHTSAGLTRERCATSATMGSPQAIPTDSRTVVAFDDVQTDTLDAFEPSNNQFVAPTAGTYHADASVVWDTAMPADVDITLVVESGTGAPLLSSAHPTGTGGLESMEASGVLTLDRGNVLKARVEQDSGGPQELKPFPPYARFDVFQVG